MRFLWLLWVFAALFLFTLTSVPIWASDSSNGLVLQRGPNNKAPPLPVVAITTCNRPNYLLRFLSGITTDDVRLVILQQGNHSETTNVIQHLKVKGLSFWHIQSLDPKGPAELWNSAISFDLASWAWVLIDDSVSFPPGAFAWFLAAVWEQQKRVAQSSSHAVLLAPGKLRTLSLWKCFALLQLAVRNVGLFDPNFYPASHEGLDYLARLSRAGLWLTEIPSVGLHPTEDLPSWAPATAAMQEHQQRQQRGRPYFALKWGQSDSSGVFDVAGHWNQTCDDAGWCKPAQPVLYHILSMTPSCPSLSPLVTQRCGAASSKGVGSRAASTGTCCHTLGCCHRGRSTTRVGWRSLMCRPRSSST
eukprot:GGOE01045116.1.p1 GENE.GGOE01045116.1~~GGOE01045116.1.p1  ORF type:complete len:360 (+),score=20.51 GGOE01045116.1:21-1100(+)